MSGLARFSLNLGNWLNFLKGPKTGGFQQKELVFLGPFYDFMGTPRENLKTTISLEEIDSYNSGKRVS